MKYTCAANKTIPQQCILTVRKITKTNRQTLMYFKWNEYIYDDCAQIKVQNSEFNAKP